MKKIKIIFFIFFIFIDILSAKENGAIYNERDFFGSWHIHTKLKTKIKINAILDAIEHYSKSHLYTTQVDAKFFDEKNNLIAIYRTDEKGLWKILNGKFITKINECKLKTIKKDEDNPDFFIVDLVMDLTCNKKQHEEHEAKIISISPNKFIKQYKDDKNVTIYTRIK